MSYQYQVGDVINGHRLNENGEWIPLPIPGSVPARKKPGKVVAFAVIGGFFALLIGSWFLKGIPVTSSLGGNGGEGGGSVVVGYEECLAASDDVDYYFAQAGYALEAYQDYEAAAAFDSAADAMEPCATMSGPDGFTEAAGYLEYAQEHLHNAADALRGGDYDSASYEIDAAFVAIDQAGIALGGSSSSSDA